MSNENIQSEPTNYDLYLDANLKARAGGAGSQYMAFNGPTAKTTEARLYILFGFQDGGADKVYGPLAVAKAVEGLMTAEAAS